MPFSAYRTSHLSLARGKKPRQPKYDARKVFSSMPTSPVAGEGLRRALREREEGGGGGVEFCWHGDSYRRQKLTNGDDDGGGVSFW